MFRFGWWTTGRDRDAVNLFKVIYTSLKDGDIQAEMAYCFVSKEPSEGPYSDEIIKLAGEAGIPVVHLSALKYLPELRARDKEEWRDRYHEAVLEALKGFSVDLVVLAGYMWVVSPRVCKAFPIINLHPAAPSGPSGTWQEVIWKLIEQRATDTGVMMHLVTPELDKGPPVTFCRFKITGDEKWSRLWSQLEADERSMGLQGIKKAFGESYPLFARIREEGVKRELPLMVETLKAFGSGDIYIKEGRFFDREGNELSGPYDLTNRIEEGKR